MLLRFSVLCRYLTKQATFYKAFRFGQLVSFIVGSSMSQGGTRIKNLGYMNICI